MSSVINESTRFPSSALRASPRMHGPRRGTRHGPCSSRARSSSVLPTRLPRATRPSSVPGDLSHLMRTGSPAQPWPAMTTPVPRIPNTPALSWRLRRGRAAAPPTPPSGTAIRSTGRLRLIPTATHRTEPQPAASPVAVLIYLSPAASVLTNQHFKALLSSAAGKPVSPSAHTPPPIRPRLLTEPATKPGSAPGPQMECLRRQTLPLVALQRGGRCRLMLFPPPWFSPLGTPLSEAPPFKKGIRQGGEPIRGDTARLSFVYVSPPCTVNASSTCRRRQTLDTFTAWVAGTTPPLRQSPQPPREAGHTGRSTNSLLSARLPALGGRVGPGPARCTSRGPGLSVVSAARTSSSTMPTTTLKTPPDRSCRSPSSQAVGETVTNNPAPGEAAASRHRQPCRRDRRALSPSRTSPPSCLPLSESRRLQDRARHRPWRPSADRRGLRGRRPRQAAFGPTESRENPHGSGCRHARIRPGGRNRALSVDRHENDARGSRARPLNESTKVTAWGNPAGINMHGGGWVLGRVRS